MKSCGEGCTGGNRRSLENFIPHNINAAFKKCNSHLTVILLVNIEGLVIFLLWTLLCRRVVMGFVMEPIFIGITFLLKNRYIKFISSI